MKRILRRGPRTGAARSVRPRPLGLAVAASLLASLAFSASAIADTVTTGSDLPNQVRWAPLGQRVLVGWIYEVELD